MRGQTPCRESGCFWGSSPDGGRPTDVLPGRAGWGGGDGDFTGNTALARGQEEQGEMVFGPSV